MHADRRRLDRSRTQAEDDTGAHSHNPPASFSEDAPAVQMATRDAKTTAHAGMLDAAKAIVDDLRHTGVFEALLTGRQIGKHKLRHDCKYEPTSSRLRPSPACLCPSALQHGRVVHALPTR